MTRDQVPDEEVPTTGTPVDEEALRRELEEARAAVEDYKDRYLRAHADLDNQRKRMTREVESRVGLAKAELVRSLLPVKDGLEAGLAAGTPDTPADAYREGLEVALSGWDAAFAAAGVEPIDPVGQPFDPELHEAVATQPASEDEPPNTVVAVTQKGYTLDGRLIRPARVVVTARQSN
jgi:molecular chaperone GrpE